MRPCTVGNRLGGPELAFTAAVDASALRLPLLSADAAALRAVTQALNARAGRELPRQTFDVDRGSGSLKRALKERPAELSGRRQKASESGAKPATRRPV